jgi:hypothetical protein
MKPMSDMLRCYIARTLMQRNKGSAPPAYPVVTPYVTASCRLGFHDRCNAVRAYSTPMQPCACRCHHGGV